MPISAPPKLLDCPLVEIIAPPRIEQRPERTYVGIRVITPFRGMLKVRDELLQELRTWIEQSDAEPIGYGFLRFHVIDMDGPMDLEVGYLARRPCNVGGRVQLGSMPAGRYATLTHRDHSVRANRALLEWAQSNAVELDRHDEPEGDAFACRYEAYLTNPSVEPRKTKWDVEIAIRVTD